MSDIVPALVSTIIPVYNRSHMLREAVDSVFAQTYRPIEIIISDDGSTDETPRVAQALANDYPDVVRVVINQNRGPGPAREAGRQLARGEFIQYLDSDDLLRATKFEIQVEALRANPHCGAAYGYICLHPVDGPPQDAPYKWSGRTLPTLFPGLLVDRWWNTDAPLFRRTVCDAVGPWSDLSWSQDWEYDGRVGALGTNLVHCKQFVCDQRQHAGTRQTSYATWLEPERLQARKRFFELMLGHAERAGVAAESPERQHFTRWIFATARRFAAVGLCVEARGCMRLAERSAGTNPLARRGFRMFYGFSRVVGTRLAGRFLLLAEKVKSPGQMTLEQSFAQIPP